MPEGRVLQILEPEKKKMSVNWWALIGTGVISALAVDVVVDQEMDFFDLNDLDWDDDKISNHDEGIYGLNPKLADSDGDGVTDTDESVWAAIRNPATGQLEKVYTPLDRYAISEAGEVVPGQDGIIDAMDPKIMKKQGEFAGTK